MNGKARPGVWARAWADAAVVALGYGPLASLLVKVLLAVGPALVKVLLIVGVVLVAVVVAVNVDAVGRWMVEADFARGPLFH